MSKSILKILRFVPELVRDPFLILYPDGEIVFANRPGQSFFKVDHIGDNISDHLTQESLKKFNDKLDKLFRGNQQEIVEQFLFCLNSGERINVEVRLRNFEHENNSFVFCTIIPQEYENVATRKSVISTYASEQEIIKKDEVIKILNTIKSLYPITFIGKERIHALINDLEEIFYITDLQGNLIVTNDYFNKILGLKGYSAEGKNFLDFIPGYLANLNSVIINYVNDTTNCLAIRGIYFLEINALKKKEIVLIPLLDNKGKAVALMGYSQEVDGIEFNQKNILLSRLPEKILNNFPKPVAFITNTGDFLDFSNDFCKILKLQTDKLHGLKFADILPKSLAESIQRFILSPDDLRILPVNRNFEISGSDDPDFTIYLSKLLAVKDQNKLISIFIEKIEYAENLQHLIKSRGRMFESLIENNPEPIFIYDKENLQFLEANQSALELYGYSREEFLLMDLTDLYNPEDIQTLLGSSNEKESRGKYSTPYRHKKKDGSSVYVELSKFSFKFNNRDVFCNIIKDVSERLELTKDNQIFKAAFNNSSDLIFVTDSDGIITFVNSAALSALGKEKNELINSTMASIVEDDDRLTINTSIFQSYLAEPVELNIKLKCEDGKNLDTEISATPVVDFEGSIESFVIIGKIIQSDKEKSELTDNQNIAETSDTAQLQTAFLSGVFHEILTPMNVILGFAQELTEGIENLSPDQKEAVEIINQNRGKLLSTMNAIIEFSDIQKDKNEWEITELTITKVVEEIDRDIFEITGSKEINFTYGRISSSLKFETDKKKFDCLVNNFIRLVFRLISDDKVYFSAYQVAGNNFIIMISDNYASVSESLADTLKKLFVDKKDPKELGIPKLGVQIVHSLSKMMNLQFVHSVDDTGKIEAGFLFPIKFYREDKISDQKDFEQNEPLKKESKESEDVERTETGFVPEHLENEFTGEPEVPETENISDLKTPDILSSPENKFDAIDFVSSVDDSSTESEADNLTSESTSVTDDINESMSSEIKSDHDDLTIEHKFEPLTSSPGDEELTENIPIEKENSFSSAEGTETTDIKYVPADQDVKPEVESGTVETKPPDIQDKSDEDSNLINRQAFTFEEASDSRFTSSDDKLELNGLTCLYIEDQVDSQILFKVQMKGLKDIKYAVSFEDAMPLLESEKFDFIVMDINLQGEYNGLDALKLIHKMQGYEGIPIIAVTAYVLPGDKEKFIATGFNDFISKPIFREKMVESLEKIFLQKA